MGREKCKWESCVLCAEGGFYFFTVRRILYVHINFPTPCSADSVLLLLLLLFYTFMSTLTYHPFCFLFSCAHACVGELEKLSSRYFSNVCRFLPLTEHVENIINFISYGLTPHLSVFAAHFSEPH